jgi:hypothetical protein
LDSGGDKLTTNDFVVVIVWFQVCDVFLRLWGLL